MSAIMQRYRVPSIFADIEVSLDKFKEKEIADYLRHRGLRVACDPQKAVEVNDTGGDHSRDGVWLTPADIFLIEKLALCGQLDQGRQELADIVSKAIGRPL